MAEFRGTIESLTQSKLGLVPTIRTRSRRTNLSAVLWERAGGLQTLTWIPGLKKQYFENYVWLLWSCLSLILKWKGKAFANSFLKIIPTLFVRILTLVYCQIRWLTTEVLRYWERLPFIIFLTQVDYSFNTVLTSFFILNERKKPFSCPS